MRFRSCIRTLIFAFYALVAIGAMVLQWAGQDQLGFYEHRLRSEDTGLNFELMGYEHGFLGALSADPKAIKPMSEIDKQVMQLELYVFVATNSQWHGFIPEHRDRYTIHTVLLMIQCQALYDTYYKRDKWQSSNKGKINIGPAKALNTFPTTFPTAKQDPEP